MKKENKKTFCIAISILVSFVLWTILVSFVDVKAIGPQQSVVGLATINNFFHKLTGVNMCLYNIIDWLGIVPFVFVFGFAILGFIQLIKRKSLLKVDNNIILLGAFYIVVFIIYILFEVFVINYRPIMINDCLEASYPSSTTMLVLCVMPTAIMQFYTRIKNNFFKITITVVISLFIVFMVVGRLLSGVHWLTDIIGGILLSTGLVTMYYSISKSLI